VRYLLIMSSEKTDGCGRDRKRKRQSPKGRGAIFLCNPNLFLSPSVLRQNGADVSLSLLPCVGSAAPLGLPPTVLKIFLSPSALSLPLPPILSLSSSSHAHTKHDVHTRSLCLSLCYSSLPLFAL